MKFLVKETIEHYHVIAGEETTSIEVIDEYD